MGIEQICNTIKNYFSNVRPPFPQLPRLFLVCSMMRRPGLSTIQSVGNIVKDLNKMGIPTGPMPNGCPNSSVGYSFAYTKEIYRAFQEDASIQGGYDQGTLMVQAGPFPGMNTTPSNADGDGR